MAKFVILDILLEIYMNAEIVFVPHKDIWGYYTS